MSKHYLDTDVYKEALKRISFSFDNFKRIYLSFSGGKDSSVMMHLVMNEAKRRQRKIGILFVDLEGQYKLTIEHIKEMIEEYKYWIELYWIALPIALRNAVSMHEPKWCCWEPGKEWIRQPDPLSITDIKYFPFFVPKMEFEEFVPEFGKWYSKDELTCCMVGIRADESLNRFRTIVRQNKARYKSIGWTTQVLKEKTDNLFNAYPIYDWKVNDIWKYNGEFNKKYNKLYDYMYQAGVPLHDQRICQPYGDDQRKGLFLFHLIEPETWGKVVSRVMGANFGAIYNKEIGGILGNIKQEKPECVTWQEYVQILLESLPDISRCHFEQKIAVFINWYSTRGFENGIPDESDPKLEAKKQIPSWRRICKAILKNDFWCKSLSFAMTKSNGYLKVRESCKHDRFI
jgi:predicted phosphoadenosine phosphosulfate sulfurtransferase